MLGSACAINKVVTANSYCQYVTYKYRFFFYHSLRDLWELRCKQYTQTLQHTQRYVYQDWIQSETELTRERGLWGSEGSSSLDKWILDTTEGPHRMRKKTMRNELFYLHYPYRPELEMPDNVNFRFIAVNINLINVPFFFTASIKIQSCYQF